jgi:hypothetical protein
MPESVKTLSDNEQLKVIAGALEHLAVDIHNLQASVEKLGTRLDELHGQQTILIAGAKRQDALLTEFEPVIRRFASPVAALTAKRRARKGQASGH